MSSCEYRLSLEHSSSNLGDTFVTHTPTEASPSTPRRHLHTLRNYIEHRLRRFVAQSCDDLCRLFGPGDCVLSALAPPGPQRVSQYLRC